MNVTPSRTGAGPARTEPRLTTGAFSAAHDENHSHAVASGVVPQASPLWSPSDRLGGWVDETRERGGDGEDDAEGSTTDSRQDGLVLKHSASAAAALASSMAATGNKHLFFPQAYAKKRLAARRSPDEPATPSTDAEISKRDLDTTIDAVTHDIRRKLQFNASSGDLNMVVGKGSAVPSAALSPALKVAGRRTLVSSASAQLLSPSQSQSPPPSAQTPHARAQDSRLGPSHSTTSLLSTASSLAPSLPVTASDDQFIDLGLLAAPQSPMSPRRTSHSTQDIDKTTTIEFPTRTVHVATSAGLLKRFPPNLKALAALDRSRPGEMKTSQENRSNQLSHDGHSADDIGALKLELSLLRRAIASTVPEADYLELKKERDQLRIANADLQQRLAAAEAVEDRLTLSEELEKKNSRLAVLQAELERTRKAVSELSARVDSLEKERREADVTGLQEALKRATMDAEQARKALEALEAAHRPCERIIRQLQQRNDALEPAERAAWEASQRAQEFRRQLQVAQVEHEVQIRELNARLAAAESRAAAVRNAADRDGLVAREKLSAAHSQLLVAEQELEALRRLSQTAHNELASANSAQASIANQLNNAKVRIDQLEQALKQSESKIDDLEKARNERVRLNRQMRAQLEAKSEELAALQHSLAAVTSELNDALQVISQACVQELEHKLELEALVTELENHQGLIEAGKMIRSEALMRVVSFCTSLEHRRTQRMMQAQKLAAADNPSNENGGDASPHSQSAENLLHTPSSALQNYLFSLLDRATTTDDDKLARLLLEPLIPYYNRVKYVTETLRVSDERKKGITFVKEEDQANEADTSRHNAKSEAISLLTSGFSDKSSSRTAALTVKTDQETNLVSILTQGGEAAHEIATNLRSVWTSIGHEFQMLLVQRADVALRRFLQRWKRQTFAHRPTRIELDVSTAVAAVELITNWTHRLGEVSSAGAAQIVARILARRSRDLVRAFRPSLGVTFSQGPAPGLLVVSQVEQGSGADLAGLTPGDVVISINGVPLLTPEDARRITATLTPGKLVTVVRVEGGRAILSSSSDTMPASVLHETHAKRPVSSLDSPVLAATIAAISSSAQFNANTVNPLQHTRRIQAQLLGQQVAARAVETLNVVVGAHNCGTHFMQRVRLFANGHITMMDVKRYLIGHKAREHVLEQELLRAQGMNVGDTNTYDTLKSGNVSESPSSSSASSPVLSPTPESNGKLQQQRSVSDFEYGADPKSLQERREDEVFLFGEEAPRDYSKMVAAEQSRYRTEQCERAGLIAAWGRRRAQATSQAQLLDMTTAVETAGAVRLKQKEAQRMTLASVNSPSDTTDRASTESTDLKESVSSSTSLTMAAFPQPSVYNFSVSANADVYLGGSCDPTTWRRDIVIPVFERKLVSYYNPQRSDWSPDMVTIEAKAKEESSILLFVIDDKTRAIASMLEASEFIARGRTVILVIQPIVPGPDGTAKISDDILTEKEVKDLNRARIFLQDLALRHGVPIFTGENAILEAALEAVRRCGDLVDLSVGNERDVLYEKLSRV